MTATSDNSGGSATAIEAVEKAYAAESGPSPDSPSPASPEVSSAAPTPAATSPVAGGSPTTDAPEHRIEAAVRNAREKANQEWKEKVGWADGLEQAKVKRALDILSRLDADPKAFVSQVNQELGVLNPTDPDPDLVSADGKLRAYSADAMRQIVANVEARMTRALEGKIRPALDFTKQQQDELARNRIISDAHKTINTVLEDARKTMPWLAGKDNDERQKIEGALAEKINGYPAELKAQLGPIGTFYRAASEYYYTVIQPAQRAQAEATVDANNKRKAAASLGTVGPAGSAASRVKRPTTVDELAAHLASMPGADSV